MDFLQQYGWCLVSLFGALFVLSMLVQGGQTFIFTLPKNEIQKKTILSVFRRKWIFSITALVAFVGVIFASFPAFYSVSFGGATYIWTIILLTMIIQAVGFDYRAKSANSSHSTRFFDCFLTLNGLLAPFFLGVVFGTFFFGAKFSYFPAFLTSSVRNAIISSWDTSLYGLDALTDYRNILLGISILFLSRTLGLLHLINSAADEELLKRSRKALKINGLIFLVAFVAFVISILQASGIHIMYQYDETGYAFPYFVKRQLSFYNNFISMPIVSALFLTGCLFIVLSYILGSFTKFSKGIWISALGTVFVVVSLLVVSAWNGSCYYSSLTDTKSSLTLSNSSSSKSTLELVMYASYFIPVIFCYILWVWRSLTKGKIAVSEEVS